LRCDKMITVCSRSGLGALCCHRPKLIRRFMRRWTLESKYGRPGLQSAGDSGLHLLQAGLPGFRVWVEKNVMDVHGRVWPRNEKFGLRQKVH
jgi:hypothetical protein